MRIAGINILLLRCGFLVLFLLFTCVSWNNCYHDFIRHIDGTGHAIRGIMAGSKLNRKNRATACEKENVKFWTGRQPIPLGHASFTSRSEPSDTIMETESICVMVLYLTCEFACCNLAFEAKQGNILLSRNHHVWTKCNRKCNQTCWFWYTTNCIY